MNGSRVDMQLLTKNGRQDIHMTVSTISKIHELNRKVGLLLNIL